MKNIQSNFVKTFFVGVLLIVAWKIIDINWIFGAMGTALSVLTPFIFGSVIAFFTYRPSVKLEIALRQKCKKIKPELARNLSVIFVYLAFAIILTILLQFLIPAISKNIQDLISNMPSYYKTATAFIKNLDLVEYFNIEEKLTETLSGYLSFDMMGKFVGVISSVASSMLNVVLGIVLSIYILIERRSLLNLFKTLVGFVIKDKKTTTLTIYTTKLVEIFNSYFVSLLLDAVIIGGVSAVFFYFFGAPYPWLLGLIIAIGNMIPFFGPIVAAVTVYIICALVMGPFAALWALLFQIIVGQLDSNILQPRVVGDSVGISPLWVIFAVTFFGGIWGPLGMILGVPIVASLRFLYHDYKDDGKLDGNLSNSQ